MPRTWPMRMSRTTRLGRGARIRLDCNRCALHYSSSPSSWGVLATSLARPGGRRAAAMPDLSGYPRCQPIPLRDRARRRTSRPPTGCCARFGPTWGRRVRRPAAGDAGRGQRDRPGSRRRQPRGLRATANPRFVKPSGGAAPVLREGQKIVFGDFECAVAPGPFTACTKGQPGDAVDGGVTRAHRHRTCDRRATAGLPRSERLRRGRRHLHRRIPARRTCSRSSPSTAA